MNAPAKVLVINDNPVVRLGLERLLASDGLEVIEAVSGEEGLRLAQSESPVLVLVEAILPDIKGIEIVRKLRSEPACAGVLTILLSCAPVGPEAEEPGYEAGADWCVTEGTGNLELRARLRAMLRVRQAEAALRFAQRELDLQVQERTAALISANSILRRLSHRLVEVQESERRDLARELHDEIGQALTGLKLSLRMAIRNSPVLERTLKEPFAVIDDLMARVRRMSLNLRPQLLDDLGLVAALKWHFERYFRQTGLQVRFQNADLAGRLPPHLETAIYRVVQEALTNVARHAHASSINVCLGRESGCISVAVEDDGCGFIPEQNQPAQTSGLTGMRERAELAGGTFSLNAAAGKGTRILVTFPLSSAGS